MEDYGNRRNYLQHLKKISAIKNGHSKSSLNMQKSRINSSNTSNLAFKESKITNDQVKFRNTKVSKPIALSSRTPSTQQIMSNYLIQKQNLRLVQRIGTISPQINLKQYSKQYEKRKSLMKIHSRIKHVKQYYKFKIFDISFQSHANLSQIFTLYEIQNNKKKFIAQGNIFQLRKLELKALRNNILTIKIQGNCNGIFQLKMNHILTIRRNKVDVGTVVIDIL